MLAKQFFETTRGRIVALLRRGPMTTDEIAAELDVTPNAIRAHITSMEADRILARVGRRAGATRPSQLFELTADVEQLLSRAYIPLLTQIVQVVTTTMSDEALDRVMRQAGKSLAHELTDGKRLTGSRTRRVARASELMNEELGAVTYVEHDGQLRILGRGCPLAALTGKHPAVCRAIESLLAEILNTPVHECCDRGGRPRCCFEVHERS
jgi:DeoR family transcriptional regulator, suf operon transcriptional repressor